ncbi:MAG: hypothetical protein NUV54_01750, partial [Candidatus Taylorbacteria bacterium]|nr:hypothetical protein [Candidatus Taylorbacteria bacterium]
MIRQVSEKTRKGEAIPKVYVGMSGGVDSSVSSALLKEAGYDVTGVFIKVWQPLDSSGKPLVECTWKEDRLDAMRVCARLNIPFVTLDLEKEYKKEVVDYMIAEYKRGNTPNPDVMCNTHVKFGGFYRWAMKQGADFVATGHYARVGTRESPMCKPTFLKIVEIIKKLKIKNSSTPEYVLVAGVDVKKDPSSFLWTLTQEQLAHTLFTIGALEKTEVR